MDTRVKLLRNAALTPFVGMVTVTAPGVAGGLVWDEEWCAWRGRHRHSGREGCRVRRDVAAVWNEAAPEHWRKLHRRARQAASRYAQRAGCPSWGVLARMWEFQRRGVLHVHVVLPMTTAAERRVSRVYAEQLARLAVEYGFGNAHLGERGTDGRTLSVMGSEKAGRYLASYIAPIDGRSGKLSLTETVVHRDVPGQLLYVSRRLTQVSGCTMRSLRRRRHAWWLARDCERMEGQASLVMQALRQHGCPEHESLADYFDWWLRQPPDTPCPETA